MTTIKPKVCAAPATPVPWSLDMIAACNAYPQLVADRQQLIEALRECLFAVKDMEAGKQSRYVNARALLRSLGEEV